MTSSDVPAMDVCVCMKNTETMTSVVLMVVVMLGVFVESSESVTCYSCTQCPADQASWETCTGRFCTKTEGEGGGSFTTSIVGACLPSTI